MFYPKNVNYLNRPHPAAYRNQIRNITTRDRPPQRDLFIENRERLRALQSGRGGLMPHHGTRDTREEHRRPVNRGTGADGRFHRSDYRRNGPSGRFSDRDRHSYHSHRNQNQNMDETKNKDLEHHDGNRGAGDAKPVVGEGPPIDTAATDEKAVSVQNVLSKLTIFDSLAGPELFELVTKLKGNGVDKETQKKRTNPNLERPPKDGNEEEKGDNMDIMEEDNGEGSSVGGGTGAAGGGQDDYFADDFENGSQTLQNIKQSIQGLDSVVLNGFLDEYKVPLSSTLVLKHIGLDSVLPEDIFSTCLDDYRDSNGFNALVDMDDFTSISELFY